MAIDLFAPRTLQGVVERMPETRTFLRDTFFNNTVTFPTKTVEFDMVKGGRELAPFVHPKLDNEPIENQGFQTKEYEPPELGPETVTTAEDLMVRQPGEHIYSGVSPAARALRKLSRDMQKLDEMITRREEWMAAQAIFTGKIPVVGKGLDAEIDFNFTNSVTLTTDKWSNTSTDILGQLEDWSENVQKTGYVNPDMVIMDKQAANALVNNQSLQGLLDIKDYDIARVAPRSLPGGVKYIGTYAKLGLDFYQYNEWYVDNWTDPANPTTKQLVPAGTIAMMSTEAQFSRLYGAVTYIPYGATDFVTVEGDRVPAAWVAHNPDRKFIALRSKVLTVPHEVDSWMVVKVL